MSLIAIKKSVQELIKPERVVILQKFFKTKKGEYAEGDIFVGLTNPESRKIAKDNKYLKQIELSELLKSQTHEERFIALVILNHQFKAEPKKCYQFYLSHLNCINNWDLVDCSCYHIVGAYLLTRPKEEHQILFQLAKSDNLWKRRISIVSTMAFIKKQEFDLTLNISKMLLSDQHDLIHKATGWMLREVGKYNQEILTEFLKEHYDSIPRTALRYAIEKFEETKRKKFLRKSF